ncbi:universal stress protein [Deinococcus yavapaiensis]|uniref:Nucleotide-binding universal stress UspA family protein n=1 Tax=Deinococcus yavapaiensis KR-236 TaxID=694435 RepID=A0A318S629_9DEIO|nr:universal stress protein [Deinococcus yavapaiensis]PYE51854.1 nucleotide-binding universal stress UspA family protein [Deinococcus yavapaiensis KR-236]
MTQTTFQRILVPIDFSPSAARALTLARTSFPGAQVKLLHVVDARAVSVTDYSTGGVAPVAPPVETLREEGRTDVALLQSLAEPGEEYEVLAGEPVSGILNVADRWNADLIVMGTHGRTGLAHFFAGSVTERMVRESPIPVLTVRV